MVRIVVAVYPLLAKHSPAAARIRTFASFDLSLSGPWEYRRAGYSKKKTKRIAYQATAGVYVWQNLKRFRKHVNPDGKRKRSGALACCCYPRRNKRGDPFKSTFGPLLAEVHFVVGEITAGVLVHELTHALSELPRKAGGYRARGKMAEVVAYRMQRIVEAVERELYGLGLNVLPVKIKGCR